MSPPLPPRQEGRVTLTCCLTGVALLTGAFLGAARGGWKHGAWGAVVGLPAGAVLGVLSLGAFWVVCYATVIPIAILCTEGPRGVWDFVRGRWVPPTERPQPNQPTESDG